MTRRFLLCLTMALASSSVTYSSWKAIDCEATLRSHSTTATNSPRKFTTTVSIDCAPGEQGCCWDEQVVITRKLANGDWMLVSSVTHRVNATCGTISNVSIHDFPIGSAGTFNLELIITDCDGTHIGGPFDIEHTFP